MNQAQNTRAASEHASVACSGEHRRAQVRHTKGWNGLDYVELSECQLILSVYFLGKAPRHIQPENIRIDGGRRVTDIAVSGIEIHRQADPDTDDYMQVYLDKQGDFSPYRLSIIAITPDTKKPVYSDKHSLAMAGFDPRYSSVEFNFNSSCASDLDCNTPFGCAPAMPPAPEINYLAKDFSSFRQLILDRLALTMPEWREHHIPDLGITLVELLAYVGDHLSYYQDAVATEAYLDTARLRVSVRRHVRLVDYHLHEGCNARTWVVFDIAGDISLAPTDFYLITRLAGSGDKALLTPQDLPNQLPKPYVIFEPLVANPAEKIKFYQAHNAIRIYTWGDDRCCLSVGATSASLLDPGSASAVPSEDDDACHDDHDHHDHHDHEHHPQQAKPRDTDYKLQLAPCDILLFEEVKGAATGHKGDANPLHRHAVRLVKAQKSQDPLTGKLIWEVEWAEQDALPFALCISSINRENCSLMEDVSLVRGNVLLVDHGETIVEEPLGSVPETLVTPECGDGCTPHEPQRVAGHFRPTLGRTGLTFRQPLPSCKLRGMARHQSEYTPASRLLEQEVRAALPVIALTEAASARPDWQAKLDLLGSTADDQHFVVEIEDDRSARLRFGDNHCARFPAAGASFSANYRVGNGICGNVGAESISHIVFKAGLSSDVTFLTIRNPLPALGGTNPEPVGEAKLLAPQAFKKRLERAITAQDYADIVLRDFGNQVQRATATLRWAGSWYEVLVTIDPLGTDEAEQNLLYRINKHLRHYRRIGHTVVVKQARYVPLQIKLCVQVLPHFLRAHVKAALLDAFSNRLLPGGRKGFFHPDNLSFGEGIYLSQVVATAQAITGVENLAVTQLQRQFEPANHELESGLLALASFEIARLDQDPNFPENGNLILDIRGGR